MDLVEAVAIFIPSKLTFRMIDRLMSIAPLGQTGVDIVLIGIDEGAGLDSLLDYRFDGGLLNTLRVQHTNDDLTAALDHTKDGGLFGSERTATALAFEPSAASWSSLFSHNFRIAFVTSHHIDLITLDFVL
jgi:hypothetical protein